MTFLNNGGILPSSLISETPKEFVTAFNKTYNSVQLRAGIISLVHDIDSPTNYRKNVPEYDVLVMEQDKNRGITTITYKNCISMDSFGGVADFFEFKRRPKTKEKTKNDFKDCDGQLVLLLCLDGSSEKGIIIGGIKHASRLSQLTAEAGLNLQGEYNGVHWGIDKEGSFSITFKGPTNNDGTLTKKDIAGSQVNIEKDGSIELNTKYLEDKPYDKIRIDKTKGDISISSRANQLISIGKSQTVTVKEGSTHTIGKDFTQSITGTANQSSNALTLNIKQAFTVNATESNQTYTGNLKVTAKQIDLSGDMVKVGTGASMQAVLGPMLIAWLSSHVHTTIAPGAPTTPPMVPPPSSMLSTTVTLKS